MENKMSPKTKRLSKKTLAIMAIAIIAVVGLAIVVATQPVMLGLPHSPTATPPASTPTSPSNPNPDSSSPPNDVNPSPSTPNDDNASPSTTTNPSPTTTPDSTTSPPLSITAKFYDTPTISADGTKVTLPYSFVNDSKIVNVDLKLQTPATTIQVGERTITLSPYRDGNYLPLLIIITPQQNLIAAVRVCEPCHTFAHNIVNGVLECDSACQSKWNWETLAGISGMCKDFPPPKLPASIEGNNIVIDFSQLQIKATP